MGADQGDELRPIVRSDVLRHATDKEQVRQFLDDIDRIQLPSHSDGQVLAGELVDDAQQAELAPIIGAVLHKVIGPDMVGMSSTHPSWLLSVTYGYTIG